MGQPPKEILFVSDVVAELNAARTAGFQVALSVRPGNAPQTIDVTVPRVERLTDILPVPAADRFKATQRRQRPWTLWFVACWLLTNVPVLFGLHLPRAAYATIEALIWIGFYWVPPRPRIGLIGYVLGIVALICAAWAAPEWLLARDVSPLTYGVIAAGGLAIFLELLQPKLGKYRRYGWVAALAVGLLVWMTSGD